MASLLYNPFNPLRLNKDECFLTGVKIPVDSAPLNVFPKWILDRYDLHEKTFTMLGDGNIVKYKNLTILCSLNVIENAIDPLEKEIETAFSSGYDEVIKLPKEKLFQWITKLVYGILYNDLSIAIQQQNNRSENFDLSPYLKTRFKNLHAMLQSLVTPMEYKDFTPWSIEIVKINYSKDVFNYKDETNKLNFSLGMNNFGIVCCMQDNNINSVFHKTLVQKISNLTLHPIQFEELCGRFIYSNYLIKRYPEYSFHSIEDKIIVEKIPSPTENSENIFLPWEDEMFGQVLANYWKPWGIPMSEIITFPNAPISFLLNDYSEEIIAPESISLPY